MGRPCTERCPQSHRVGILGRERSSSGKASRRGPWRHVPSATIYHPKVWERGAHRTPRGSESSSDARPGAGGGDSIKPDPSFLKTQTC